MTGMSPLTNLIVLMFLLLIAVAAVAWWTLTAGDRAMREQQGREERESREERPARPPRTARSNDAVRGARAPRKHAPADAGSATPPVAPPGESGVTVRPRKRSGEDPFERFLDPERRNRDDRGR